MSEKKLSAARRDYYRDWRANARKDKAITLPYMAFDAIEELIDHIDVVEAERAEQARIAEGLAAEIVHAQMVLQEALGVKEVDYTISLTDLADGLAVFITSMEAAVHDAENSHHLATNWVTTRIEDELKKLRSAYE